MNEYKSNFDWHTFNLLFLVITILDTCHIQVGLVWEKRTTFLLCAVENAIKRCMKDKVGTGDGEIHTSHRSRAFKTVGNMDSYKRKYPIHSLMMTSTASTGSTTSSIFKVMTDGEERGVPSPLNTLWKMRSYCL